MNIPLKSSQEQDVFWRGCLLMFYVFRGYEKKTLINQGADQGS